MVMVRKREKLLAEVAGIPPLSQKLQLTQPGTFM